MCTVCLKYICIREMVFLTCTEHTSTMSPVNETQDYDYLHRVKGANQIWSFKDYICKIESQKAMKCVLFAVNVYAYVKCSPRMHRTMSPVSETQDYDYLHQVKGAVKN